MRNSDVKVHATAEMPPCSRAWMAYFLVTIFVIGFPLSVGVYIPLYFLSFIFPGTQAPADFVLRWGIGWLMRVQPWLNCDFDIEIPNHTAVLLISNHRSHLDVFLLLSRVKGIRILAKKSLFAIPLLGIMMKVTGQIPTERGRLDSFWQAMDLIRGRLRQRETVHVFPEMTRCEAGFRGTKGFMVAPFLIAKELNVPVIPLLIDGTDDVWPRGTFALRPFQRVRVRTLAAIEPSHFASVEELCKETQRRIDEALA